MDTMHQLHRLKLGSTCLDIPPDLPLSYAEVPDRKERLERALHQDTLEARLQRKLDSIKRDGITVKNLLKIIFLHVIDDENQRKEMVQQAYRNAVLEQLDRDE